MTNPKALDIQDPELGSYRLADAHASFDDGKFTLRFTKTVGRPEAGKFARYAVTFEDGMGHVRISPAVELASLDGAEPAAVAADGSFTTDGAFPKDSDFGIGKAIFERLLRTDAVKDLARSHGIDLQALTIKTGFENGVQPRPMAKSPQAHKPGIARRNRKPGGNAPGT